MSQSHFPNLTGVPNTDDAVQSELELAGIRSAHLPEFMRKRTGTREVDTVVVGAHLSWNFERGWRYWVATGPGIPYDHAMELHERIGQDTRVDGFAGGQSPDEFKGLGIGHYHVDSPEGLLALRETLDKVHAEFLEKQASKQLRATGEHQ